MTNSLARFQATNDNCKRQPTAEELLHAVLSEARHGQAVEYLELRPRLKTGIEKLVACVREESFHRTQLAAYFRYKERERISPGDAHGHDFDDWLAAEKELLNGISDLMAA